MDKNYWLALWWWWARGFAHIWVYKYLEENEVVIDELSWTSMWAIIASMIAIWKTSKEIEDFAKSINYIILWDFDLTTWLIKWKKVEKKLEEVFWNLNIEETNIPLKIVATNIEKNESFSFSKWKIVNAIRASLSLPWVFMPKEIDWETYVDWWIMMNLPIEVLNNYNIIASSALKISEWKIVKTREIFWIKFKSWLLKNSYETIKRSVILLMKVNEDRSLSTEWKKITLIRPSFWELDIADFDFVGEHLKITGVFKTEIALIKQLEIINNCLLNVDNQSNIIQIDLNGDSKDYRMHKKRNSITVDL